MLVAEGVLGNVDGEFEAARERHAAAGTLERVVLDERERRRARETWTTPSSVPSVAGRARAAAHAPATVPRQP
jgi:urease accessory protein UreE